MIGGWESFHGLGGNWDGTLLAKVLPVEIDRTDDRMNFDQSAWLVPVTEHPILNGLPWVSRPPAIGGMNRVAPKAGSTVLANAYSFAVSTNEIAARPQLDSPVWSFSSPKAFPAVVVGNYGAGRTAVFASDVAPHWVGGFVDWGADRVTAQAENASGIEVGSDYAHFWMQLLEWTMGTRAST
jgi:uncharacterized membrane protein